VAYSQSKGKVEEVASTLSATKIISNPPLKIRSVTGRIACCLIELHDLLMTAYGHSSVLDVVVAPITHDLILEKP